MLHCFNLWCSFHSIAAGFDFTGGSYVGLFTANETAAVVTIPIVKDLNSTEGAECFVVHLSAHSVISDAVVISLGNIREATVCIQDEIILSFEEESVQVKEGENLTLTVTASTSSSLNFTITVNITSNRGHCKLKYSVILIDLMVVSCGLS